MGLALTTGIPKIIPNQFNIASDTAAVVSPVILTDLVKGYPAEQSGLQKGDKVINFAGEPINDSQELITVSKAHKGEKVTVDYVRGNQNLSTTVQLRDADTSVFGATLGQQETVKATWSAPITAVVTTAQFTWVTLQGLGDLVVNFFGGLFGQLSFNPEGRANATKQLNEAGANVAGPVGILGTIFPAASEAGFSQVVFLAAIISLTLAVMNALPIPALDGGRWFVTALFKVFKKPLTKEREELIHGTGFMVLMALIVVITIADVSKLF